MKYNLQGWHVSVFVHRRLSTHDIHLEKGIAGEYPVDKIFTWNSFTSTSVKKDQPGFGDLLFEIEFDENALDGSLYIRPYSKYPGMFTPSLPPHHHPFLKHTMWFFVLFVFCFTGEFEVLLPPGFMMKVMECDPIDKVVKLKMIALTKIFNS